MDADAEVTRNRLGALNCQVKCASPLHLATDCCISAVYIRVPCSKVVMFCNAEGISRPCGAMSCSRHAKGNSGSNQAGICRENDVRTPLNAH